MDVVNTYEHLVTTRKKKAQNSIKPKNNSKDLGHYVRSTRQTVHISKQEIQVCSNIPLTPKWIALRVESSAFNVFLLDFSTSYFFYFYCLVNRVLEHRTHSPWTRTSPLTQPQQPKRTITGDSYCAPAERISMFNATV